MDACATRYARLRSIVNPTFWIQLICYLVSRVRPKETKLTNQLWGTRELQKSKFSKASRAVDCLLAGKNQGSPQSTDDHVTLHVVPQSTDSIPADSPPKIRPNHLGAARMQIEFVVQENMHQSIPHKAA